MRADRFSVIDRNTPPRTPGRLLSLLGTNAKESQCFFFISSCLFSFDRDFFAGATLDGMMKPGFASCSFACLSEASLFFFFLFSQLEVGRYRLFFFLSLFCFSFVNIHSIASALFGIPFGAREIQFSVALRQQLIELRRWVGAKSQTRGAGVESCIDIYPKRPIEHNNPSSCHCHLVID